MHEMEAQFGFTPGKPVPRVKASDLKAMWKLLEDVKARHPGRQATEAVGTGGGMVELACGPESDVNAVFLRSSRLGMLMMMCGKPDSQPPAILFSDLREAPQEVEGIRRDASWFVLSAAVFLGEPTAYSPPVPFVSIRKVRVIPSPVSPAWRVRNRAWSERHLVLRR